MINHIIDMILALAQSWFVIAVFVIALGACAVIGILDKGSDA